MPAEMMSTVNILMRFRHLIAPQLQLERKALQSDPMLQTGREVCTPSLVAMPDAELASPGSLHHGKLSSSLLDSTGETAVNQPGCLAAGGCNGARSAPRSALEAPAASAALAELNGKGSQSLQSRGPSVVGSHFDASVSAQDVNILVAAAPAVRRGQRTDCGPAAGASLPRAALGGDGDGTAVGHFGALNAPRNGMGGRPKGGMSGSRKLKMELLHEDDVSRGLNARGAGIFGTSA